MKTFSKFMLWLMGWKIHGGIPEGEKKAVIVAAPHTSNWDFFIGRFAYFVMGVNVKFLIKKEVFKGIFGKVLLSWGGIPIDRSKSQNMVEQVASLFDQEESLYIVITPEGTRSLVEKWKKGFYYIALKAKVPIALAYMDYGKKEGGIGPTIHPGGNFEEDLKIIESFYKDKTPKYPEKFNLSPVDLEKKNIK